MIILFCFFSGFSHPLHVPLRSWQPALRSQRAGNLLPFGLNSITLRVPYSIHKQEARTLLLREDVVKEFIFRRVHSYFAFSQSPPAPSCEEIHFFFMALVRFKSLESVSGCLVLLLGGVTQSQRGRVWCVFPMLSKISAEFLFYLLVSLHEKTTVQKVPVGLFFQHFL